MTSYIIDYDNKLGKGVIKSNNLDLIREAFSVEDTSAKFNFRSRFKNSRIFAITQTGRYEAGLSLDIAKKISQIDNDSTIIITNNLKQQILCGLDVNLSKIELPYNFILRNYQLEVVHTALKRGRGIILIATAGGKTLVMYTLIRNLITFKNYKKVVIISPTSLVKQTHDEFKTYDNCKSSLTWWTGEHSPDERSQIIVVGTHILLSDKQDTGWLMDADALLIDEVHGLRRGNKINKIIKKFKTNNKFGFTGTLPEDLIDQWSIKGLTGPVIFIKDSHSLRQEEYIAQAVINVIKLSYLNSPDYYINANPYLSEVDFLIHNTFRNNTIKKIAEKCDKNILILVDRIEHGEILKKSFNLQTDKQVFFIRGEVESIEREKVKNIMEANNNVICIAITAIFSTGINIKNLHYIIFAASGKAKIRIIQSIGRGLRLHENKNKLVIFDIYDDLKYGNKHYDKRKLLYEREQIPIKFTHLQQRNDSL